MKRFKQEQFLPAMLACGVLLMLGWFTLTTAQLYQHQTEAASDFTQPGVPVLMYHHLLPEADRTGLFVNNNAVISVEQFTRDMQTLKARGYQTISLRQLHDFVTAGKKLPAKSVLITFDDGYLSNKVYAMPVLEELDYTAVIFVLTGWIEQHPQQFDVKGLQYLSWPEIKEMRQTFQFASHTDNLHSLSWNGKGALTSVSEQQLTDDIHRSVQKLQGTTCFSYPYGHYTDMARTVLRQQGITLAFTVTPGNVKAGDDPLTLSRWDMYQYSIDDVLQQKK